MPESTGAGKDIGARVQRTDRDGAADVTRVIVAVTNAEDKGMAAPLEMHPRFGEAATSNQRTRTARHGHSLAGDRVRRPGRGRHGHQQGNAGELDVDGD